MDRLKTLGTWVLLVIAFFIFSNVIIHICLNNGSVKREKTTNSSVTNQIEQNT